MNLSKLIIFLVPRSGKQFFYIAPPTVRCFWDKFQKDNKTGDAQKLSSWVEIVPPVLRSKIIIYEDNFIDFKDINKAKRSNLSLFEFTSLVPFKDVINPYVFSKDIVRSHNTHFK